MDLKIERFCWWNNRAFYTNCSGGFALWIHGPRILGRFWNRRKRRRLETLRAAVIGSSLRWSGSGGGWPEFRRGLRPSREMNRTGGGRESPPGGRGSGYCRRRSWRGHSWSGGTDESAAMGAVEEDGEGFRGTVIFSEINCRSSGRSSVQSTISTVLFFLQILFCSTPADGLWMVNNLYFSF